MSIPSHTSHNPLVHELHGRVALVTGASSGLGVQFARTLAQAGASVALAGRRLDKLQQHADTINKSGGKAIAIQLDVANPEAIAKAVSTIEQQLGIIDILVNNAGISGNATSFTPDLDDINQLIDVNLKAPYLLCMTIGKRLIDAKKPGNIVNLSSIGAFNYGPGTRAVLYCATKSAIVRLTECLSVEWAKFGINVNAIAPGFFRSEMSESYIEKSNDKLIQHFPRKRIGEPEFLQSTLLFLVSQASHAVTGTCVKVNDGQQQI